MNYSMGIFIVSKSIFSLEKNGIIFNFFKGFFIV